MDKETFERLVAERNVLQTRVEKLLDFLNTDKFKALDEENQFLLNIQAHAMGAYFNTLNRRIEINENKENN